MAMISTMHNWQSDTKESGKYRGDHLHLDMISIPGTTMENTLFAFRTEYEYNYVFVFNAYMHVSYRDTVTLA